MCGHWAVALCSCTPATSSGWVIEFELTGICYRPASVNQRW